MSTTSMAELRDSMGELREARERTEAARGKNSKELKAAMANFMGVVGRESR